VANRADEQSRVLGGLVVVGAVLILALFLAGIASKSYWAIAIPVGVAFTFVIGLVIWIGWTIATVPTDASGESLAAPSAPTPSEPDESSAKG